MGEEKKERQVLDCRLEMGVIKADYVLKAAITIRLGSGPLSTSPISLPGATWPKTLYARGPDGSNVSSCSSYSQPVALEPSTIGDPGSPWVSDARHGAPSRE